MTGRRRGRVALAAAVAPLLLAACSGATAGTPSTPSGSAPPSRLPAPAAVPPVNPVGAFVVAVIGDYGSCALGPSYCEHEQAVADLVHSWHPDEILTVGDNTYDHGSPEELIPDQQPYDADVKAGRFWQTTGNHDWLSGRTGMAAATSYFGHPSHWTAHWGNGLLDVFSLDMNRQDPDTDQPDGRQAQMYAADLAQSHAVWKITATHQPFYSSGEHGTAAYTHWAVDPAVDLFLSGHDHDMEHLVEGGKDFVVDGIGGRNRYAMCTSGCIAGSQWHQDQEFGATRLVVTPASLRVDFVAVGGRVLHSFSLTKQHGATVAAPSAAASPLAQAPAQAQPATVPSGDLTPPIRAAFYYPWYPEAWNQQGMNPFTHDHPAQGFYDSSDPSVIRRHIAEMQYGNIEAGIASWWGQATQTDGRVRSLLAAAAGTGFRWALYYEPEGQGDPSAQQISSDLHYIRDHYASDPSYLRVGGRFVVFVYNASQDGCAMTDRWHAANDAGAFVVLKVFPGYASCPSQSDAWHQYSPAVGETSQHGQSFSVSPGFFKATEASARLPRDVAAFRRALADMAASDARFQLITTFNEWGEGTAVEPAAEWSSPSGYGAYLDALHAVPPPAGAPATGAGTDGATGGESRYNSSDAEGSGSSGGTLPQDRGAAGVGRATSSGHGPFADVTPGGATLGLLVAGVVVVFVLPLVLLVRQRRRERPPPA